MLRRLEQIEFAIAAVLLAAIVLLVFMAAIMRFFGATRAMRQKGHIGIDLLVRHLGHRNQLALEMLLSVVILIFLAILAYEGIQLTLLNSQRQFGDSGLSYAWVTSAVPAGCVMLGAALAYNFVTAWRARTDGKTLVYSRTGSDEPIATEL